MVQKVEATRLLLLVRPLFQCMSNLVAGEVLRLRPVDVARLSR